MKVILVIPARWNSKRFPGKPLAKINGIELIKHVWDKAIKANCFHHAIVATDNKKIQNFCLKNNINVILTSVKNRTGTDRVYEVSKKINGDIYVNLQGDEPLINPKNIKKVVDNLKKNIKYGFEISTAHLVINSLKKLEKSCVYLTKTINDQVLLVSRSPIPSNFELKMPRLKHVGIFAFTKKALKKFAKYKVGILEKNESIELLRFLENQNKVITTRIIQTNLAVDYPSDIKKIENYLRKRG